MSCLSNNISHRLEIFEEILMKHIFSCIFYFFITLIPLWLIGFGVFVLYVFSFRFSTLPPTDGIATWTGGEYRIHTALQLLEQNQAKRLLISGVNKSVSPGEVLGSVSPEMLEKIDLGYQATTTEENALETAEWVYKNRLKSVALVTSFYHMPRSLLEFKHVLPTTTVYPHPIWPKDFTESVSWIHTRSAFHLLVEYHKFLVVKLRYFWERI